MLDRAARAADQRGRPVLQIGQRVLVFGIHIEGRIIFARKVRIGIRARDETGDGRIELGDLVVIGRAGPVAKERQGFPGGLAARLTLEFWSMDVHEGHSVWSREDIGRTARFADRFHLTSDKVTRISGISMIWRG